LSCNLGRWCVILLARTAARSQACVCYGYDRIPHLGEKTHGGIVKFQHLQADFPNSPRRFNVLYMVSSRMPADWSQLLWLARRKKAKFLWNQNGVAYPGWHGPGWEKSNQPMATLLHAADYVFYQSQFCKVSADRFLGKRPRRWEILYNAVDTARFVPAAADPDPHHLVLLLGGTQYQYYRLETALRTLAAIAKIRPDARLLVTGRLCWIADETAAHQVAQQLLIELGIADRVILLGPYTQQDAPFIFQKAHLLLHTKYHDPCPGLVLEAMACGLPVVYSQSGGVPELVGQRAGVGIPTPISWEQDFPPDPQALAEGVLQVAEQRQEYAEAARQRAVDKFDLSFWQQRHRDVFEELLAG